MFSGHCTDSVAKRSVYRNMSKTKITARVGGWDGSFGKRQCWEFNVCLGHKQANFPAQSNPWPVPVSCQCNCYTHSAAIYQCANKHNRILCSNLPPPRPSLTPLAEHMWRLLQPHTFPHGTLLAHTHPHQLASPHCPSCGALDTLFPSLCECPRDPFPPFCYPFHWERVLGSYDLAAQETIMARAQDVMRAC